MFSWSEENIRERIVASGASAAYGTCVAGSCYNVGT